MGKHAYLILAHGGLENLKNLIKSVDDDRNDIYIHIDKKWKGCNFNSLKSAATHSGVYFTPERLSVKWGGDSIVKAEMMLFEQASSGNYSYYHLLSGQDICIKNQDYIHEFFKRNNGKEFVSFCGMDWQKKARERVKYFYLQSGRNKLLLAFNKIFKHIQRIAGVNRIKKDKLQYVGGSEWVSVTDALCKYLVENKRLIFRKFSHTFCSDELFIQTMVYNNENFKKNVYLLKIPEINDDTDKDLNIANARAIDWIRGTPYTYTESDLDGLLQSPCMFARKVSSVNELPQMILDNLK